jgi:hypothetical protein
MVLVDMQYSFIMSGSFVKPDTSCTYVDVGNNLCKGIIDHHQPGIYDECAATLVYKFPQYICDSCHCIVGHVNPDLDCCAGMFLTAKYLLKGQYEKNYQVFCDFVKQIDLGYQTNSIVNMASLFNFIKFECTSDYEILTKSFEMFEIFGTDAYDCNKLPQNYITYEEKIKNDYVDFMDDMKSSYKLNFFIPKKNNTPSENIKCLIMPRLPISILFKDWARLSLQGNEGHIFTVVKLSERRVIISVKPDCGFYLKGLGDRLNEAEYDSETITKRPGYNYEDPWYDGRDSVHNYTIIDSPRKGTKLSFDEIIEIIKRWSEDNVHK